MEAPREVIERIAKLLRLAEGEGATPNEAAVAAAKAAELMERHRIDRATVEADDDVGDVRAWEDEPVHEARSLEGWVAALAKGIADTQGCDVVVRSWAGLPTLGPRIHIVLVGREGDVAVARYLLVYLHRELRRLGRGEGWEFHAGAVACVLQRLRDRQRAVRVGASSTAIVRIDQRKEAVVKWMADQGYQRRKIRRAHDGGEFERGYVAGRGVPLHDAVGGEPSTPDALPRPAAELPERRRQ